MITKRQFGVSTHLYHGQRLGREHLLEIGSHGFEVVELFATRTHLDYHNPAAIADLQQWLAEAGLELAAVHAPVGESYTGGRWSGVLSLASPDPDARARAVAETEQALHIARRIPFRTLVVHLGMPRSADSAPGENSRDSARRSLDALQRLAEPLGVGLAVEIIPNELSRAGALVHFVEEMLEEGVVGICLDVGHAHLGGDLLDDIETVSEHLVAAHVHDNRGRNDDHLVPFEGTIDWPAVLTGLLKVGYEGTLMFEIAAHGSAGTTRDKLARAAQARQRMARMLVD